MELAGIEEESKNCLSNEKFENELEKYEEEKEQEPDVM